MELAYCLQLFNLVIIKILEEVLHRISPQQLPTELKLLVILIVPLKITFDLKLALIYGVELRW